MKKPSKKLSLSTQTIRNLQDTDLQHVVGGSVVSGTSVISVSSGTSVISVSLNPSGGITSLNPSGGSRH